MKGKEDKNEEETEDKKLEKGINEEIKRTKNCVRRKKERRN